MTEHPPPSPAPARDPGPGWLDLAVVAGVVVLFAASVAMAGLGDVPMGDGWMRYLRNVQVLDTGQWDQWQRWRAPGHAWALHALMSVAGGLVQGAHLLTLVSTALLLLATWGLGWKVFGRWPALFALLFLAGWPDLRVMALQTTPYAAVSLLLATGAGLCLLGLERRPWLGLGAGLVLGLAWGTDLRASGLSVLLAGACLMASAWREVRWRGPLVALGLLLVAVPLSQALLRSVPVQILPLSQQIALQRDLNAQNVGADCFQAHGRMPALSDLLLDCTRRTALGNWNKLRDWLPVPAWLAALLAVLGAFSLPRSRSWRLLPHLALLVPAVGTFAMVPFYHRYCMLIAAPAATLGGAGLWWILRRLGPRAGPLSGCLLLLGLAVAWQGSPDTLLARVQGRQDVRRGALPAGLTANNEVARLVRTVRQEVGPDAPLTDCTRLDLGLRLYPRPVRFDPPARGGLPDCTAVFAAGDQEEAWVVAPAMATGQASGWRVVERFHIERGVVLLRSDGG